jgi:DNA-binding transcriptional ArsR family regulator
VPNGIRSHRSGNACRKSIDKDHFAKKADRYGEERNRLRPYCYYAPGDHEDMLRGSMSIVKSSFAIVAEPNRRAILSLLLSSERSVGEIERELRLSQPSVSKHLRVLREAGFVESRIEAQRRLYRLRPEPLKELDAWLVPFRRFWSKHVDALGATLGKDGEGALCERKEKT